MRTIRAVVGRRQNYRRRQLLLEDDFLAEQKYHIEARCRHNLNLHGWGVVHGLAVLHESDHEIVLRPGVAIDKAGHELFLDQPERIDLAEFGPNEVLRVSLRYEEILGAEEEPATLRTRYECYAIGSVSKMTDEDTGVTLAIIRLDSQGKLEKRAIDDSHTRHVR